MESKILESNRRVDVVVACCPNESNKRYVIELMASDSRESERCHIMKTLEYGRLVNAAHLWMIHYHYGLVPETDIHHHARSENGQSVHVIVASHVNDPAISQTVRKFYYAAPDPSIAWTSLD